jgi:hypothetical protein
MDEEDILETTGIQHPLIIYPIYLYKDDPLMVIILILCTCTMFISFLVYFSTNSLYMHNVHIIFSLFFHHRLYMHRVPIPSIFHAPVGLIKGHDSWDLFTFLFGPFIKSSQEWIKFWSDPALNIASSFSSTCYHLYALETTLEVNQLGIDLSPLSAAPLPGMAASHQPVGTKGADSPGHSLPVGVFCTGKIHGGQDCTFLFWGGLVNYIQSTLGFILIQAPPWR